MPSITADETVDATALMESHQQRQYPGLSVRREGESVVVHVPVRFRRRNGRQMILMASDQTPGTEGEVPQPLTKGKEQPEGNEALIKAIAKAYLWQDQLESGKYACIEDLAHANKVDRTYISRMLRLTNLAPDIVEAIIRGDEPNGLSLRKLQKGVPVVWAEQRKRLERQ